MANDIILRKFQNHQLMSPLRMTRLGQQEVIEHLMIIDLCSDLRLSGAELAKCRKRFMRFCQDQFENRN